MINLLSFWNKEWLSKVRYFIVASFFTLFILLLFSFWVVFGVGKNKHTNVVLIPYNSNASEIALLLEKENIIADHRVFLILSALRTQPALRRNDFLQAGEYRFNQGESLYNILRRIQNGDVLLHSLTIPEGSSVYQIVALLNNTEKLQGTIKTVPEEGKLFPDTYHFTRGGNRNDLIARMQNRMKKVIDELWNERAEGLFIKTKEEALILASVVERETGRDDERKRIAAVFYNRLRRGIALQSDPTLIYWESDRKGFLNRGLRRSELRANHPYNSYLNGGLPPGPIANPGRKAIEAVLNPIQTKDFYFVANGKGGHNFAKTLREHNRNVKKWRELEKRRKIENRR